MADRRTLLLASPWELETEGVRELRDKIKYHVPSVYFLFRSRLTLILSELNSSVPLSNIEYDRDGHLLVLSGQFDGDFEIQVTSLFQNYIEEHRHDDLLEIPRIGLSPIASSSPPQDLYAGSLVDAMISKPTADEPITTPWFPNRESIGPISSDFRPLFVRVSEMTETTITAGKEGGLYVSARQQENNDNAIQLLTSLDKCFDYIESPNLGLIISTPDKDSATFRIMPYSKISETAVWRILIGRCTSVSLREIMTLVVCQFDDHTNEFRPIHKIRLPQSVNPSPEASSTKDWKYYQFPEISRGRNVILEDIDQHLAPEVKNSDRKSDAQSAGQARSVDNWISTDVFQRNLLTVDDRQGSPTQSPASREPAMPKPPPGGSSNSTRWSQGPSDLSMSTSGTRYLVVEPDGRQVPFHQARREGVMRMKKISRLSKLTNLSASYHTDRELKQPTSILRSENDSKQQQSPSGRPSVAFSTSPQTQELADTPDVSTHRPRLSRPLPPAADRTQIVPQGGRTVDSVIEELKEMMEISKNRSKKSNISRRQSTTQTQPGIRPRRLETIAEENANPNPLSNLDCEINNPTSDLQLLSRFKPLVPAPGNVPGKSVNTRHDQRQIGKALTRNEADYILDQPNEENSTLQSYSAQSDAPSPQGIPNSSVLHSSTLTSLASEPACMDLAANSSLGPGQAIFDYVHESHDTTSEDSHHQGQGSTEKFKKVAMEYLHRHIEESLGHKEGLHQGISDTGQSAPDSSGSYGDIAARGLSTSLLGSALPSVQRGQSSPKREGNVPILREDLIDISLQSVSSHLARGYSQQSSFKNENQVATPDIQEELAATEEVQTRKLHKTMFHQRPCERGSRFLDPEYGTESNGKSQATDLDLATGRTKTVPATPWKRRIDTITASYWKQKVHSKPTETKPTEQQSQKSTDLPTEAAAKSSKKKKPILNSSIDLFHFLRPVLDAARSFPGTLSLEIQFGLMFIPSLPYSTRTREMSYREVQQIFSPDHALPPPSVSMFERITAAAVDIDYLIDLKVNQRRLFESDYSDRGIKYEFWCVDDSNNSFVISVSEHGHALVHYPEVSLGTVHLSFPSQIWDAAARVRGFLEHTTGIDLELDEAVQAMVNSIYVEPNNEQLRMLVRFPLTSKIKIDQVIMKRWSRHPYLSNRSKDLFLHIIEFQELSVIPSILDPGIMVVRNAPIEQMVKDGKQWWQASIGSSKIEEIIGTNEAIRPGECNKSWYPPDLLGTNIGAYAVRTEDQDLSPQGAEVGSSGIGEMFQLAKTVVENIDAIGFWNKGPAYVSADSSSVGRISSSKSLSTVDLSTTLQEQPTDSSDLALVPWGAPVRINTKRKW
ncbi:hypothetical protein N7457_006305 [Penicillium paradoxum]|uniref:uncharacterized protein n=1 Tax=Penicillium paradoxum TaxID=176176 RepID=UPI0025482094|nr:uncharacterized protein N7457_006305 [Penicillium paradoxum]KAJ5781145.1 hypothetical protein N7457_006305 [Penicillium paradoxum]